MIFVVLNFSRGDEIIAFSALNDDLEGVDMFAGSKLVRSRVGRENSMYLSVLSYEALMLERPSHWLYQRRRCSLQVGALCHRCRWRAWL